MSEIVNMRQKIRADITGKSAIRDFRFFDFIGQPKSAVLPALFTFAFTVFSTPLFASGVQNGGYPKVDIRGNSSENFASRGLRFTLHAPRNRFSENEAIVVECRVYNEGMYPITVYLHNDILRNFTLIIRDDTGKSLPLVSNKANKTNNSGNFYSDYTGTDFQSRAIVLQPGESINREIKLNELVLLDNLHPGLNKFHVSAYFYPNAEQSPDYYVASGNGYPIYIDTYIHDAESSLASRSFSEKALAIDPREIVYLALSAEYARDWPTYFKYFDLNEVIRDYPEYARKYMHAPANYRGSVIEEFQQFLIGSTERELIRFEVLSESVENETANVKVKAVREIDGFEREFVYTYYLNAKDLLWQISGVDSHLSK